MIVVLIPRSRSRGLYNQNMTVSTVSSELILLYLDLVWWYNIISQMSCEKMWLLCSRSGSQWRFKMPNSVYLVCIFWTTQPFGTKLGEVMQCHELEYHPKRLVCYLEGQSHSDGSYDQNMRVSAISFKLLILSQPNLVWWYIIISHEKMN